MADFIFYGYNGEDFDPAHPPKTEEITGHDFPLAFCGTSYRRTAEIYAHVLAARVDWSRIMYAESIYNAQDSGLDMVGFRAAYMETIKAAGVGHLEPYAESVLWNAVAYDEKPSPDEEEIALSALGMDDADDLYWVVRGLRHRLAVRLGFIGSLSDDDYQPVTLAPEAFAAMGWEEVDHDPEEESEED